MITWTFISKEREAIHIAKNEEDDKYIMDSLDDWDVQPFLLLSGDQGDMWVNLTRIDFILRKIINPSEITEVVPEIVT